MTTTDAATDQRHRQQLAVAALAHLLTLPAPDCLTWDIRGDGTIHGQLPAGSPDATRVRLAQWAAILEEPQWSYRVYTVAPDHAHLSVAGTFLGRHVEIWDGIDAVPEDQVAELTTPPQPAGQDEAVTA
ncbi:hypothetical protein [Nonomuraea typhae]|uniref:hypothetical protein n=1 Tax=Nonomuraea typhae TaxID=2603600 RepID=UPI0012FCA92A|nr:hypothetical protein [Nonomuraea typhae]